VWLTLVALEVRALGDFVKSALDTRSNNGARLTRECLLDIDQLEILKGEVLRITKATTASIWTKVCQKQIMKSSTRNTYGYPLFTPVHL
jgi:hypothetical protein